MSQAQIQSSGTVMEVSPDTLQFQYVPGSDLGTILNISNKTKKELSFQIKTNAPHKYCVVPAIGSVQPGQNLKIKIIMKGFERPKDGNFECHDQFVILNQFDNKVTQYKLNVKINEFQKEIKYETISNQSYLSDPEDSGYDSRSTEEEINDEDDEIKDIRDKEQIVEGLLDQIEMIESQTKDLETHYQSLIIASKSIKFKTEKAMRMLRRGNMFRKRELNLGGWKLILSVVSAFVLGKLTSNFCCQKFQ